MEQHHPWTVNILWWSSPLILHSIWIKAATRVVGGRFSLDSDDVTVSVLFTSSSRVLAAAAAAVAASCCYCLGLKLPSWLSRLQAWVTRMLTESQECPSYFHKTSSLLESVQSPSWYSHELLPCVVETVLNEMWWNQPRHCLHSHL